MNNKIVTFKKEYFKSLNLFIYHSLEYDFRKGTALLLLSEFIGKISKNYPDKTSMLKYKDDLYAAYINAYTKRIGDVMSLIVYTSSISPSYIDDLNVEDMLNFIDEALYNLDINEKYFEEFRKQNIEAIRRNLDKPSQKSFDRLIELISNDQEEFITHSQNYVAKTISEITLEEVKKVYEIIKKDSRIDVYLSGCFDDKDENAFEKYIRNNKSLQSHTYYPIFDYSYNEYEEKTSFTQSYLYYVLNNSNELNEIDEEILIVLSMMYGMSPSSLLFRELREERSLCYNCGIRLFKNEGLMIAYAFIDSDNKDIALEEMKNQFRKIKNNDFDLNLFVTCKENVIEILKGNEDDPEYIIEDYHNSLLKGKPRSLEDKIKLINEINVEDVVELANDFNDYLVYFSKGIGNEKTF